MTIQNYQVGTPSISLPGDPPIDMSVISGGATGLTPDALMTYCQTRLGGIDSQVKQYFAEQQKANNDRAAINDAMSTFNHYAAGFMDDPGNRQACSDLEHSLKTAIDKVGPDTDAGKRLTAVLARVHATGMGDDNKICADEMKGFMDDIKGVQSDIGSNAELGMIQLQSLMSQRQVAVQLCTNMVQSLDDESTKIVGNVGH